MKTRRTICTGLILIAACSGWADDITATLDSTDGSSAFLVRDSTSNVVIRASGDGNFVAGYNNIISNWVFASVISGGRNNDIGSFSIHASISGSGNSIGYDTFGSTIGGGVNSRF